MKIIKSILIALITSGCLNPCLAQSELNDQLKPLAVLIGEWSGSGSQSRGPGNTMEFSQTEKVSTELNGQLLVFRGIGHQDGQEEAGFKAFGVMSYDKNADQVFIHAWTLAGEYTKAPVEIGDGSFKWSFDVPNGGKVRYSASFDENSWSEHGEYSPDNGANWYPFMEMNLTR